MRVSWMLLSCKKQNYGAESRNRTGTVLLPRDFESRASTSSAIPAQILNMVAGEAASIYRGGSPARGNCLPALAACFEEGGL
jgi:hypothetical protein